MMEQSEAAKRNGIKALLEPKSIAIIGASNDPSKISGKPIEFLKRYGYEGDVFPINPKYKEIQGHTAYRSILNVPSEIDLAIIALPAKLVVNALKECAKKGVKSAVIYSSGFAEIGGEGRQIQNEITTLAKETGLRVVGPNCQGLANLKTKSIMTFSSNFVDGELNVGSCAIISQSGGVASMIYSALREHKLGVKYWISTGNEADVNVSELVSNVIEDSDIKAVQVYMEDVKGAHHLIKAAKRARELNKPILVLKSGKTKIGQKAASYHTGALPMEDTEIDATFRDAGIIRVDDVKELGAFSSIFASPNRPKGKRTATISNSGALGVMAADKCIEWGLELAELKSETKQQIAQSLPIFASVENPIDVTAQLLNDKDLLSNTLPALIKDPNVDIIILLLAILGKGYDVPRMIDSIQKAQSVSDKLIVVSPVASQTADIDELFMKNGIPTVTDPTLVVKAVAKYVDHSVRTRD